MTVTVTAPRWGDRYLFVPAGRAGLAVDLATGGFWELNPSAALVCRVLATLPPEARPAEIARVLRVDLAEATRALAAVTEQLAQPGTARAVPGDDFPYRREGELYVLYHRETPLLEVDTAAGVARLAAADGDGLPLEHVLRLASPKILQANGVFALHAAACRVDGRLVALSGRSGAGKSTTARLLAEASGGEPFADDLLVLALDDGAVRARAGAEAAIYRWCADAGRTLAGAPTQPLPLAGLLGAARLPDATLVPVDRLVLVAAERRGEGLVLAPLAAEAALTELVTSVFLGASDPAALRAFFLACAELAAALSGTVSDAASIFRATVPAGLPALRAAVRALIPS